MEVAEIIATLAITHHDTAEEATVKLLVHGGRSVDAVIEALGADHPLVEYTLQVWSDKIRQISLTKE